MTFHFSPLPLGCRYHHSCGDGEAGEEFCKIHGTADPFLHARFVLNLILNTIDKESQQTSYMDIYSRDILNAAGYPRHRENRENGLKKIPVRENTGNLEILSKHREKTGNFV